MAYNSRSIKVLGIGISLIASIFAFVNKFLPFRAQGDETRMVPDIRLILEQGHLVDRAYHAGIGYQIEFSLILKLIGKNYPAAQWLSPSLGAIFYIFIFIVSFSIWRRDIAQSNWWGFALTLPTLFIFAGLFNRFLLTSHKKFTMTIPILMVFIVFMIVYQETTAPRLFALLILLGIPMGIINNAWGMLFGAVVPASLIFYKKQREKGVMALAIFAIYNFSLGYYSDLFSIFPHTIRRILLKLILYIPIFDLDITTGPGKTTTGSERLSIAGKDTVHGVINEWKMIHIFDYSFPSIYLWGGGIAIVALLSFYTTIQIIQSWITKSSKHKFGYVVIGTNIGFIIWILMILSRSDIDSARRLIPIPGLINIIYLSIILSDYYHEEHSLKKPALTTIFIILLIFSVLATPRIAPNGNISPYDIYINKQEQSSIDFINSYGSSSIEQLGVANPQAEDAAIKQGIIKLGEKIRISRQQKLYDRNVIYTSGVKESYQVFYHGLSKA